MDTMKNYNAVDGLTGDEWKCPYYKKSFSLNKKVFKIKLNFKK